MPLSRTLAVLFRTPLVRQPSNGSTPLTLELQNISRGSSVRPTLASRLSSRRSFGPAAGSYQVRGYASDKGKMELYSDESGSTGAGIDDVAKSDAAYDTSKGPKEAAKGIEEESGKDFTQRSPANEQYSKDKEGPKDTSKVAAEEGKKD